MDCSEALDLLYNSFDGGLVPSEMVALAGHRRACFICVGTMRKAENLQSLLRHVPALHVPVGFEERIIRRAPMTFGAAKHSVLGRGWHWRGASDAALRRWPLALTAAAAAAVFLFARGLFAHHVAQPSVNQSIIATVVGALVAAPPGGAPARLSNASAPLVKGEVIGNAGQRSAIVAVSPYLALTIGKGAQVRVDRLRSDPATGDVARVDFHLDRGSLWVRHVSRRQAEPVSVTTNQATIVPTGTYFGVSVENRSTHVIVAQGSVAVYVPGRTFNVLAGQGVRIFSSGVLLRDRHI